MNGSLKCSVVIPTYNREVLLRHTLNSLAQQRMEPDEFEVLVVDDGSCDDTEMVVASFLPMLNVRYFHQPDEGYRAALARNIGITHAAGEITVLLDSGVVAHSDLLTAHVASHVAADEPVAVCGYVYCFNLDNEDAALINEVIQLDDPDATVADLRATNRYLDVREIFYSRYGDVFADLPAPWLNYWTCNVSARTEQLRAVGMFDEGFSSWGGEDLDLGFRLHRDGARFVLNREAAAIHVPHEKNFEANNTIAEANYRYMAAKYDSPIVDVLLELPNINFFEINDIILDRGLVSRGVA